MHENKYQLNELNRYLLKLMTMWSLSRMVDALKMGKEKNRASPLKKKKTQPAKQKPLLESCFYFHQIQSGLLTDNQRLGKDKTVKKARFSENQNKRLQSRGTGIGID